MSDLAYTNPLFKRVKSQLGAPVREIELTDDQMNDLLESAYDAYYLLEVSTGIDREKYFEKFWSEQYFVALCKEALGRIRGKFSGEVPIPGAEIKLAYEDLLNEAHREKQFLRYLMLKDKNVLSEYQKPILVFYVGYGNLENSEVGQYMEQVKKNLDKGEDGFTKYFIPLQGRDSRIECIYPVSGVDSDIAESIKKMEETLKNMNNE